MVTASPTEKRPLLEPTQATLTLTVTGSATVGK